MNHTPDQARELYRNLRLPIPADLIESAPAKASKLRNVKKEIDGILFASGLEARAYLILKLWERAGRISALELQPRYLLLPGIINQARPVYYVADFCFYDEQEQRDRVVDCKGFQTATFKLKSKMFAARYPLLRLELWTREDVRAMERCR